MVTIYPFRIHVEDQSIKKTKLRGLNTWNILEYNQKYI